MPKTLISTYTSIETGKVGDVLKVNKIISEQDIVPNIQKEVSFGKFSKKLSLKNKVACVDMGRE